MQLDQPIPPGSSGGENPYDFILSGAPKPKLSLVPKGGSQKQRIILVASGAIIILIIFVIVFSLIANSGDSGIKSLVSVAQTQTEIVRVSTAGTSQVRDPSILNFTENVSLGLTSSQIQTINYLTKHQKKISSKELALGQSASTNKKLSTAQETGNYDNTMLTTLQQELTAYQAQVIAAYKSTDVNSQKVLLQQLYTQVTNLLKNSPSQVSS